jgi:transcriptional regulator with XRE-family HTH domain
MGWKFKSQAEIDALAAQLGRQRRQRALTLQEIEKLTGINCAQLSRFERGEFKTASNNLQILCKFLHVSPLEGRPSVETTPSSLTTRIENIAGRSQEHRLAVEEILQALERLT